MLQTPGGNKKNKKGYIKNAHGIGISFSEGGRIFIFFKEKKKEIIRRDSWHHF
jgi:hypothetical protein